MALSIIDTVEFDEEVSERREMISLMRVHQVATTALPHWLPSYARTLIVGTMSLFFTGYLIGKVIWGNPGPACQLIGMMMSSTAIVSLCDRNLRRSLRRLRGGAAATYDRFDAQVKQLDDDVALFNKAVRSLRVLGPVPREAAERRLESRREALIAQQATCLQELDDTFGGLIVYLEERGLWSRAKIAQEREVNDARILGECLGASVPALPAQKEEDPFERLERLHGHEIPR